MEGTNKSQIKGIIVGTGRAGTYLHFGAFKAASAEIVAFIDTNVSAAKNASEKYRVPYYYQSIEEALNNHEIDFVSVCTPSQTHYEIAKIGLDHGCHILVEKPLAHTMEEADKLNAVRLKTNKTVCVVHNHKFLPGIIKAKKIVDEGAIGNILHIYREMSFTYENVHMMEPEHWAHKLPGGRLMEANPHNLYLLHNFMGTMKLEHIYPRKITNRWPHAIIDEFTALLSSDKATATIKMSLHATAQGYGRHGPNFLILIGTKGTLIIDYRRCKFINEALSDKFIQMLFSMDTYRKRVKSVLSRTINLEKIFRDSEGEVINIGIGSGHRYIIERFVGYLTGKYNEPPTTWEEGYFVQKLNYEMGMEIEKLMGMQEVKQC